MTDPGGPLIDAGVHVFFASDNDLRTYLREPFKSRGYPHVDVAWFAPPGPRYVEGSANPDRSHPGSDPEAVGRVILEDRGFDYAILHPMTAASILPDWHLGSAILAATNQMLVERWLDSGTYAERFRGTIRVNPRDIDSAVREIERWKDHPRVVQIGLPMQTEVPYGRPQFKPLWRAASDAGLPVAVHIEMGVGITHPPTPSGITRTFSHLAAYQPMTFVWHLLNMIAEGVFHEFRDLKVVWTDGAADVLTPFIWRMDTFGRPHLEQTPWSPNIPSSYLPDHTYFVHGLLDGPGDADFADEWLRMTGKEDMLLFGSSYPSWQTVTREDLPAAWTPQQRAKVLGGNAAELYGIRATAPATT
ncbi:amidohydrolase family protein [Dactylosporangium sucinum]|uniref:Amidohydrolase n=1 Tax=Dactylosporangium sucinum TaxID=1424081 RepID=A0A917UDU6_9ACTN|nr:amidohydrolase family protein [Dactylosporangium sucinum]GGM75543.1 amidohydrolase [Dactylosporangium sucinum]